MLSDDMLKSKLQDNSLRRMWILYFVNFGDALKFPFKVFKTDLEPVPRPFIKNVLKTSFEDILEELIPDDALKAPFQGFEDRSWNRLHVLFYNIIKTSFEDLISLTLTTPWRHPFNVFKTGPETGFRTFSKYVIKIWLTVCYSDQVRWNIFTNSNMIMIDAELFHIYILYD